MTPPSEPSYRTIPLTKGYSCIVDANDFEWLNQYRWHANDSHGVPYAYRRKLFPDGKRRLVAMHREILGLSHGDGLHGDHINPHNTLDNRRSNLRKASPLENSRNKRTPSYNTSGFKGVSFNRQSGKWAAYISIKNRTKYLGRFSTPEEAHLAYVKEAETLFGEFARME
jgi:hypothetical protein